MSYKITLKRPTERESALMVKFMKNGEAFKFYTGKTITTKNWSVSKEQVLSGEENYQLINKYLYTWKGELKRIIEEMEATKTRLVKEEIQARLDTTMNNGKREKPIEGAITDFISFIDDVISTRKASQRTIQRIYQTKRMVILAFGLISKKRLAEWEDLSVKAKSKQNLTADKILRFEDINLNFLKKFHSYLLTATFSVKTSGETVNKHYKINYVGKQLKGLKQLITEAIEAGYVKPFSWRSIKSEEKEVDSVYTDFSEIQAMYDAEMDDPVEEIVRDKYVVNCFLGLRYSDFNSLEPHDFKKRTIACKEFVVYHGRAKKTDQIVEFAVHPTAVCILEKYNYQLPKMNDTKFNQLLKAVSVKAGLSSLEKIREIRGTETIVRSLPKYELMTSHAGRRSFCTNFYNEGVAIQAIMSISGHCDEKEFRKYVKKKGVRIDVVAEQVFAIKGLNFAAA
jgi:site-specific recombinase XerD